MHIFQQMRFSVFITNSTVCQYCHGFCDYHRKIQPLIVHQLLVLEYPVVSHLDLRDGAWFSNNIQDKIHYKTKICHTFVWQISDLRQVLSRMLVSEANVLP